MVSVLESLYPVVTTRFSPAELTSSNVVDLHKGVGVRVEASAPVWITTGPEPSVVATKGEADETLVPPGIVYEKIRNITYDRYLAIIEDRPNTTATVLVLG